MADEKQEDKNKTDEASSEITNDKKQEDKKPAEQTEDNKKDTNDSTEQQETSNADEQEVDPAPEPESQEEQTLDEPSTSGSDEPISVSEEAKKIVASEEAEKALGVVVSLESIADYLDKHQLSEKDKYLVYQNLRLSLVGSGSKVSNVFPSMEEYEQKGVFQLSSLEIRTKAETIRKNYNL